MKTLLLTTAFLFTMPIFANTNLIGSYELKSGDNSCENLVDIIETSVETDNGYIKGLRFVPSRNVGSIFEDENAEDFLNINGNKVKITSKNSSYGTKYISEAKSKSNSPDTLSKSGSLKEYNFFIRTSNTKVSVNLNLNGDILAYKKELSGSNNWTRNCLYLKK